MATEERARHVVVSSHVRTREVDGELVLLDLKRELYLGLDGVGAAMWRALTTAPTVEAAYEDLRERYEVDADLLWGDVLGLVNDLRRRGLVRVRRGERPRA